MTRTRGRAEARRATVTTLPVTPIMTKYHSHHVLTYQSSMALWLRPEDNAADPWEQWEAVHP